MPKLAAGDNRGLPPPASSVIKGIEIKQHVVDGDYVATVFDMRRLTVWIMLWICACCRCGLTEFALLLSKPNLGRPHCGRHHGARRCKTAPTRHPICRGVGSGSGTSTNFRPEVFVSSDAISTRAVPLRPAGFPEATGADASWDTSRNGNLCYAKPGAAFLRPRGSVDVKAAFHRAVNPLGRLCENRAFSVLCFVSLELCTVRVSFFRGSMCSHFSAASQTRANA